MYKSLFVVLCGLSVACGLKETATSPLSTGIFLQVTKCSDTSISLPQKKTLDGQGPFGLYNEMAAYYQTVCDETLPASFAQKVTFGAKNCSWEILTKRNDESTSVIKGKSDGDDETLIEFNLEGTAGTILDVQIQVLAA